jgi:hypothetical protein
MVSTPINRDHCRLPSIVIPPTGLVDLSSSALTAAPWIHGNPSMEGARRSEHNAYAPFTCVSERIEKDVRDRIATTVHT